MTRCTSCWCAVLLTVLSASSAVGKSTTTACQITCNNGGFKDERYNYCHCPADYYGYYCEFKRGSRCQGENARDCAGLPFHFCFETDRKSEGYDCDFCPLGTNSDCSVTDPRFVEACNQPENQCQGGAICQAFMWFDGAIRTKCACLAPRGGRLCQFEDPCRDSPCGPHEECRPMPTDLNFGRRCIPCRRANVNK